MNTMYLCSQASPINPEAIESEFSDSDDNLQLSTPYPIINKMMVVPETPDNSDSPVSE
jgi:hypothetical protein